MARRIVFFNRFYRPDESATAQILTDLAEYLASRGWNVEVVTSRLLYGDPSQRLPERETIAGVQVQRLWSTGFGRSALLGRLFDYLTVYLSFALYLLRRSDPDTVVVMKTDPPLLSVLGWMFQAVKGYQLVSWCQDVFPEVAVEELQPKGVLKSLFGAIRCLRNISLNCSDRVAVLSDDMLNHLAAEGIRSPMVKLSNWAIHTETPDPEAVRALRCEWGLEGVFTIGYSGNLGRVHDWDTVREAILLLKDVPNIAFLFIGGGIGYETLREQLGPVESPRILFKPYQPKQMLATSLALPDLHWLSLRLEMTPFVFPSKYYGILETGKPHIFVGDPHCELARLCQEHPLGCAVDQGNARAFADAIQALQVSNSTRSSARSAHISPRKASLDAWDCLLRTL